MKINASVSIINITPAIAAEWLQDLWGEQRKQRQPHIHRLAVDMLAGRFKISPDAIVRVQGKLANGQHRLMAVIESGKSQSFIVLESNDTELYKVIDCGLRRTVADGLFGITYAKSASTIAKWVISYERQSFYHSARQPSEAARGASSSKSFLTQSELITYCTENADILCEAASFATAEYDQSRLLPVSIAGALYVIGNSIGKAIETKTFISEVLREGGIKSKPASLLRSRMILNRGAKSKLTGGYIFGLALKALKFFIEGSQVSSLKWTKDEALPLLS